MRAPATSETLRIGVDVGSGPWNFRRVLDTFAATFETLGFETVTLVGHSFGGGIELAEAAWWGFRSGRVDDIVSIAGARMPAHVLWASRDSILSRRDGREFARRLSATFTVASEPDGRPVDHGWMFQQPHLFVSHLARLGLEALS